MVVGEFPIVVALLTHLLCGDNLGSLASERVEKLCLLCLLKAHPLGSVATLEALHLLDVVVVGNTLTCKTFLTHVTAPCNGVALLKGIVDNLHHLVHRYIVRQWVTPVVLNLYCKACVEGVMGIGSDGDIVVPVKTETCGE